MSPDAGEYDPNTLAAIDLQTGAIAQLPVAGLRGVGAIGGLIVYGMGGRVRSVDGAIDVSLLEGPVHYWDFLAEAAQP